MRGARFRPEGDLLEQGGITGSRSTLTVREDEERRFETQGSLPPALPPEAIPVEVNAAAARSPQKPKKIRVAVAAAWAVVVAVQLAWIVALTLWIVRIVW